MPSLGTYRDGDHKVDSLLAVAEGVLELVVIPAELAVVALAELADSMLAMLSLELDEAAAAASAEKAEVNTAIPYMLLQ